MNIARSLINQAIVRNPDRKSLFQQVCRVLVDKGEFRVAWIGWHSPRTNDAGRPLGRPQTGYLRSLRIYADDRPGGRGSSGRAFSRAALHLVNDVFSEETTPVWQDHFKTLGLAASASFPIRRAGKVCGILSVYASEAGFFRDKEVALLKEAAADLSFALDHFASERARRRGPGSAERGGFTGAMIDSLPGFDPYDEAAPHVALESHFAVSSGYTDKEIARMHPLEFFAGLDRERVDEAIRATFEQGESSIEAPFVAKDGSARHYLFHG